MKQVRMKLAQAAFLTLLLGFSTAVNRKWRRQSARGSRIAPRISRSCRLRRLQAANAVLGACGLRTSMKPKVKGRQFWVRPLFEEHDFTGFWAITMPTLRNDEKMFHKFFRMSVSVFDNLLAKVGPYLRKNSWRKWIVPGERLAITLKYLASGDSMMSISYYFKVSSQCISNIVFETCVVLWEVLVDEVMPTPTREDWLRIASEFSEMWNLVHCLGAIDGKHVRVKAFPHSGSRDFNYRKFFSLILMAVCDAKYKFISVEFGASGRRGDGNVFEFCAFNKMLQKGLLNIPPPIPEPGLQDDLPFFFVGDAAFSGNRHIVTPISGKFLEDSINLLNYRLSRARRVIENAFGILVARWRILNRAIDCCRVTVKAVVKACLVLHNLLLLEDNNIPTGKKKYCPQGFADSELGNGKCVRGKWRNVKPKKEKRTFMKLAHGVWSLGQQETDYEWDIENVNLMLMEHFVEKPLSWQWRSIYVA